MLNFHFLEKSQKIVSIPHFAYDFSRKMFLMLYLLTDKISFSNYYLLLETLGNMCIATVC